MVMMWKEKKVSTEERSRSLPRDCHPIISKLEREVILAVDSSTAAPPLERLTKLERVYIAAADVLQLPCTRRDLRRRRGAADTLLEQLLSFADAYGSLRMALLSVQDLSREAEAAIRRRHVARLGGAASSLRRAAKEIAALVNSLPPPPAAAGDFAEMTTATLSLSSLVFNVVISAVATAAAAVAQPKVVSVAALWRRRRRPVSAAVSEEWERRATLGIKEMEERLFGLHSAVEKVYRALIAARITLLNAITLP
ncbi:uncharacterized protein LOC144711747 [Wolffia australiana]